MKCNRRASRKEWSPWDTVTVKLAWKRGLLQTREDSLVIGALLFLQLSRCAVIPVMFYCDSCVNTDGPNMSKRMSVYSICLYSRWSCDSFTSVAWRNDLFACVGLSLFFCNVCFDRGSCVAGICALREDITELRSGVVRQRQANLQEETVAYDYWRS